MADMNNTIETIGDEIAVDSAVTAWCRSEYGSGHTVYENCDSRQRPPKGACPLVIVGPLTRAGGLSRKVKDHGIGIACVVHDERKTTSTAGVVRFVGGRNVEAFRGLVLDCVTGLSLPGLKLSEVEVSYDTIEQFPFVSANMSLVFTQTWTSGSSPFE